MSNEDEFYDAVTGKCVCVCVCRLTKDVSDRKSKKLVQFVFYAVLSSAVLLQFCEIFLCMFQITSTCFRETIHNSVNRSCGCRNVLTMDFNLLNSVGFSMTTADI